MEQNDSKLATLTATVSKSQEQNDAKIDDLTIKVEQNATEMKY